jgi:hypothetical protein
MSDERAPNGTIHALDPSSPSVRAEYARYLDLDLLGKILARNFLVNRLGYAHSSVDIPLGRYGDAKAKYPIPGQFKKDLCDCRVQTEEGGVSVEIKCARINIANRSLGQTSENWAFQGLLRTPGKVEKKYDIMIAVGIRQLGLEDDRYWSHLQATRRYLQSQNVRCEMDAWPHEVLFLSLCSFFVVPRVRVKSNYFRVTINSLHNSTYAAYQAWGYDDQRCQDVWCHALNQLH